jgi:hypothetical protein
MTTEEEKQVNQQVISGRRIFTGRGSSGNDARIFWGIFEGHNF